MSEWSAVQNPLLTYAAEIGWAQVPPAQAEAWRGGRTGLFFEPVLTDALVRLNPGTVDAARAADLVRRLRLLPATIEGNRDALAWMRGKGSVFVEEEGRERDVRLINFDDLAANAYHVTWEWTYTGAAFTNRADAVFLVNGLPVAVCELKAAEKRDALADAIAQLRRYHRETPELVQHAQLVEASQMLDLMYGVTWSLTRKNLAHWRDDGPAGSYETRVKAFFQPARLLRLLRDYVLFLEQEGGGLQKVILKQHQTRAVERVAERAADPHRRRGLVWHTQGSGKTLTMLTVAAGLLRTTIGGEKPTVVLLVDRLELEEQLWKNLEAAGLTHYTPARSKAELEQILRHDTRGLVVAMIHKFEGLDADLNPRASIVVLVDEAHRTTGGTLGNYLLAALPNATYVGFTGTPIDATARGKGTFKTFGTDDPQGFLDKYSIADSIKDGTTLELHYALAPSDLVVDRATLEAQFLRLTEAEGVADVEELNAILDRAVTLKEAMKAPERVEKIAAFVARDFTERVAPMGFKAFLVGVDREACALYKEALDRHLPAEASRVVISPAHNDDARLKQHYLDKSAEKKVRDAFRDPAQQPGILIVTEKLLTGFDAPVLYCLYLDKPVRDHVLLQTIARVNRPYEDAAGHAKPCGLVVDFVGIFNRLEEALAFDADTVASVIQNLDVLRRLFEAQMREAAAPYLALAHGFTDKDKERAIVAFEDPEARKTFFQFYRDLATLYDILSPDAFLYPFIPAYEALARLYLLVRNAYTDRIYVDRELTAKTRALLHETTTAGALTLPGEVHTLGPDELALLRDAGTDDTVKVLNLRKLLGQKVREEGPTNPVLQSIGERAETVRQQYEDRQITTKQALALFAGLADETVHAETERAALGLTPGAYAVLVALRPDTPALTAAQAAALDTFRAAFPDAHWDPGQERDLRKTLIQALLPTLAPADAIRAADRIVRLPRA